MTFFNSVLFFSWGEVIPLLFVKDLRYSKVVIMSQPSRRYDESVSMVPELLSLGIFYLEYLPFIFLNATEICYRWVIFLNFSLSLRIFYR